MHGILRCTYTDFFIIKSIGLLDNHLSGSTISHLDDVDALLQMVHLHTIDGVDTSNGLNVRTILNVLDACGYLVTLLGYTQDGRILAV